MNKLLTGKITWLDVFEPERDVILMNEWARDSEYLRQLDDDPVFNWPTKHMQEFFEKNYNNMITFIIRRLDDNKAIGFLDFNGIEHVSGNAWVGIGVGDPESRGKGYGTDAMNTLLNYGFKVLNLHRVTLNVFEYNRRAIRSYEKSGFRIEGITRQAIQRDGKRWNIVFMGILRSEWEALQQS